MNAAAHTAVTIENFEAGRIDPEQFDHEAHVYVGWLYVQQYELPEAIRRFDTAIKRLANKLGAEGKYHATLTWFYLLLIAERSNDGESWPTFRNNNSDITKNSQATVRRYYSEEFLFSDRARQAFVLPDNLNTNLG